MGSMGMLQGAGAAVTAHGHHDPATCGHPVNPLLPPGAVGAPARGCPVPLSLPSSSLCPLFASLSTPAPLLPSLFLSPSPPPPLASLSLSPSSYLIPLVFLLSACPADLHACCVEAAQLDLMPPAATSRAGSGLGAALLRAGEGEVGPPPWPTLWPLSPRCLSLFILFPFQPVFPLLHSCFHCLFCQVPDPRLLQPHVPPPSSYGGHKTTASLGWKRRDQNPAASCRAWGDRGHQALTWGLLLNAPRWSLGAVFLHPCPCREQGSKCPC